MAYMDKVTVSKTVTKTLEIKTKPSVAVAIPSETRNGWIRDCISEMEKTGESELWIHSGDCMVHVSRESNDGERSRYSILINKVIERGYAFEVSDNTEISNSESPEVSEEETDTSEVIGLCPKGIEQVDDYSATCLNCSRYWNCDIGYPSSDEKQDYLRIKWR